MPISWYQAIPALLEQVEMERPKSVLDVGIGFGKYGLLLREVLELPYGRYDKGSWVTRIDGVEAFRGYRNPIHEHAYDRVYYSDILDQLSSLPSYDMILLIDVLEHFPKEQGMSLLRLLKEHATKCVIVATPEYPAFQGAYNGNEYESHLSQWHLLDFLEHDFSYRFVPIQSNGAQIVCIRPGALAPTGSLPADELAEMPHSSQDDASGPALSIAYVLPHRNLTGGLKMLLEQMKHLRARGHRVSAVRRASQGEPVLPDWYDMEVDRQILVPERADMSGYLAGHDIVMAGWVEQLPELCGGQVPVVYWEQGSEWLFGESDTWEEGSRNRRESHRCYSQPCYLAAASPLIADILETKYGRKAYVIPNGVDTDFYRPGIHRDDSSILLVGNPRLRFKGFGVAMDALRQAWRAGARFHVNWVCQVPPPIKATEFPLTCVVRPSQDVLADYYRCSGIHLFTSWYEGFAMPPLEAMASGTPVVATDCGGLRTYARPGENALLADPGDATSLATGLTYLLSHPEAREMLSCEGRATAIEFSMEKAVKTLERYLWRVVEHSRSRGERSA